MLKQGLKALGQSLLIVTGVGYGVIKALEVFETGFRPRKTQTDDVTVKRLDGRLDSFDGRLDSMEERLIRMEKSLEAVLTPNPKQAGQQDFVTREEMNAAMERLSVALDSNTERLSAALDSNMERLSGKLDSDIERRFEVQNRSVQSLRTMVARTDELLEQVLESIEANSIPA